MIEAATEVFPHATEFRVLIVDDVPDNLKIIGGILDGKGVDLSFATSGAQALESAQVTHPDLVLLDVAMPEMDGYEVARRFKTTDGLSDIAVIFITARAHSQDVLDGFRAGAADYITKPFNAAELLARVFTHLELKKSRDTIRHQNEGLRASNAAKDRLLSIIAHDLKNPLHGLIGISELLLDMGDGMDGALRKGHLTSLNATARQMAKSLRELLDWAKVQSGAIEWKPEEFMLAFIVEESILLMQSAATAKEVAVTNRIASEEKVFADPIMILTVVRNLLQNAIKYSRRGGEVTISAENVVDDSVRIMVGDTGIGMHPALVTSLLKNDSLASRPGTEGELGTGLGLKFCWEFLSTHRTTLQVKSEEGKGTTFSFVLPRRKKE